MFSKFITEHGVLIVRTENLLRIEDVDGGCGVTWLEGDEPYQRLILGTAQENFDRLKAEELDLIAAAAERQQRYDRSLPVLPIPRGRQR